jgi:hypothetical protein
MSWLLSHEVMNRDESQCFFIVAGQSAEGCRQLVHEYTTLLRSQYSQFAPLGLADAVMTFDWHSVLVMRCIKCITQARCVSET